MRRCPLNAALAAFAAATPLLLVIAGAVPTARSGHAQTNDAYRPPSGYGANSGYQPSPSNNGYQPDNAYSGGGQPSGGYQPNGGYPPSGGYQPNAGGGYQPNGGYQPAQPYGSANGGQYPSQETYPPPNQYQGAPAQGAYPQARYGGPPPSEPGYGEPYSPAPVGPDEAQGGPPPGQSTYEQSEIVGAGHKFFGSISQGLASAVEYAFKSQGRPNGYILGEDAGGAFVVGLRYGEGTLYTKDAGTHKVFWQGPTVGYDAGAEGSKTMVLVYNLSDPSEIYNRFGGVQGSAYLVGGVSVQFQTYNNVSLAVIRSGVGVRLGANVGYLKYTRTPTWNPL